MAKQSNPAKADILAVPAEVLLDTSKAESKLEKFKEDARVEADLSFDTKKAQKDLSNFINNAETTLKRLFMKKKNNPLGITFEEMEKGIKTTAALYGSVLKDMERNTVSAATNIRRELVEKMEAEFPNIKVNVGGIEVIGIEDIAQDVLDGIGDIKEIDLGVKDIKLISSAAKELEDTTGKIAANEEKITEELTKQEKKDLWKKLNTFTGKIKRNLSSLSTSDMREVLDIVSKLKDAEEYAEQIQDTFGNITANFFGSGIVSGLEDVLDQFEETAGSLRNIDWGFGKLHDRNKLIEDQKEIISQLKQIGKLRYSESRSSSGIDILASDFDDDDYQSRFTTDELQTRVILLEQLRDNVNELTALTKSKKITLFDDSVYHPENIVHAIGRAIKSAQDQLPTFDDYDVPSPEDILRDFNSHLGNIIDVDSVSENLRFAIASIRNDISQGRIVLEEAIDQFNTDLELDKFNIGWQESIDGLELPDSMKSKYEEFAQNIRLGTMTALSALEESKNIINTYLDSQTPDDYYDDLDGVFESENLEHYNTLIEECTTLTGELSDAVLKYSKIHREMISLLYSGNMIPQELKDAKDQIAEVISGYFKKDFFEPTLGTDQIFMWLDSAEAATMYYSDLVEDIENKYQRMLAMQSEHDDRAEAAEREREATVEILGIRNEIQRITRNASKYEGESLKSEIEYFSSALRNLNKQKDSLAGFKKSHDDANFNDIIDEIHSEYKQSVKMLIGNIAERVSSPSVEKFLGDVKSFNRLPKEQLGLIKKRADAIRDVEQQLYNDLNELGIHTPRLEIPEFLPVYDEVLGKLKIGAIDAKDAIAQLRDALESLNQTRTATTQPEPSDLERFDADKGDGFYGLEIEKYGEKFIEKFKAIEKGIRERLSNGAINYEQAWEELVNTSAQAFAEIQSGVEDATKTVRRLSNEQRAKMFDGASIKSLLDGYHIGKDDQNEIYDEFDNLGNMVAAKMDIDDIEVQKSNIIALVLKSAKHEVQTGLESFFEELTSGKIYYDSKEIGEVGKNTFADVRSTLSSYKLLTPNREKGLRADDYFNKLSDYVQGIIKNAFEREYSAGFNGSKSNILQGIAAVIKHAPSKFTGLRDDEQEDLRMRTAGIVDKVIGNVERLLQAEQDVTTEVVKQNRARQAGAQGFDVEETFEPILKIAEESAKMIELISSAAGKNAAIKFLEGITSETDLQGRVIDYFNEVFGGDDWKFKEGKGAYLLVGDTLTAHLVNSVEDTIDAVFKLNDGTLELQENFTRFGKANIEPFNVSKAIEDATSAIEKLKLELGDISYSGMSKLEESFRAITDEKSFKAFNAQLKISQKEVKKIADDTKWVIEQNKQLDSKVRSYKYGSKQLNGTTELEDPDATSMEDSANKTIDGLADHIRTRLKNVAAGTLTDAMKNIIRDDMRVLENEIKVGQLENYTSTTMSASEVEAARKSLVNQLDTLKAQAEKSNVFDKISESYDNWRRRLTDDTSSDYIKNNFSDAINGIRVVRSELNKANAESGAAKQEQQNLENALKLQEKLYESRKRLVSLQLDEAASDSDLQTAERKTDEIERQYDASLRLLKTAEDYNTVKQRELQLEDELKTVMFEQYADQVQRAEDTEKKNIEAETKQDIARYEQEQNALQKARLEIQKEQAEEQRKQKENQEELIRLQKLYNEADYKWHQADIDGSDKAPYNEQMESYIQRMQELRKETKLTAEQQIELNKINNEHQVKKNKLLDAVAAADSKSLSELQTFSRWESDIKNVGMISDETAQRIENMRSAIASIGDSTDIQKLAEDFKALKSDVKYETTQSKTTKTRIAEIKASLEAEQKELKSLRNQLDLDLDLGDAAPNAAKIEQSYNAATEAIKKCTSAIGEQSQEEIAAAMRAAESAKETMKARQMAESAWWHGGNINPPDDGGNWNPTETPEDLIKKYYKTLESTFQQINSLDSKMYSLKLKDGGTGAWVPLIASLEEQKEELLNKVRNVAQQINNTFNDSFVQGQQIEFPFSTLMNSLNDEAGTSGTIENFFSDIRTQTVLAEQSIDKFIANLQNGQNKAEEFATTLVERLSEVPKAAKTLSNLYQSGAISEDNALYKGGLNKLAIFNQYQATLPKDPTTWSAEQISIIQKLASEVSNYVGKLDKAVSKESEYFANKKQYANIANMQDYSEMASSMDKISNSASDAKAKLESFVDGFANGRAIITGFTTSADGISRIDFSVLEEGAGYLRNFSAEIGQFTNNVYTVESTMNNMTAGTKAAQSTLASMSQIMSRLNSYGLTVDNSEYVGGLYEKMQALSNALASMGTSKDVGDQNTLQNMAADANRLIKTLAALEKSYLKVNDAVADGDITKVGNIGAGEDLYEKMTQFAKEISATMPGSTLAIGQFNEKTKQLPYVIETADGEVKTFIMTMEKLGGVVTSELKTVDKAKAGWEEFGSSFGGLGKEILKYGATLVGVHDFVRYIKQGFNEVLEIDTAMTELKKVTDETSMAYSNFLENMSNSAGAVGSTVKDLTTSAADWARLGYSLEEAGKLAENTMILMNVSEFDNVSDATDALISSLQAFKDEGVSASDYSMQIIDKINQIGNSYAISTSDLASSLTRSSAALVAANNSLEESIALTTAANTVIQDPDSVGNALKVVSMRIRGVKTELEEAGEGTDGMVENTAKLQEKIMALTNIDGSGGIDILTNSGEFKSTYDIILSISKIWEQMGDVDQAALLELIAGKQRGSVVAGLLQNGDILESVYESASSADGSAAKELETYLDSIQGKVNTLTNSIQTMWINAMDSEVVKLFVDLANMLVQATDKAGLLNVALAVFLGKTAFSSKKFGIIQLLSKIPSLANAASAAMNALGSSFSLVNGIATAGASILAGLVINGIAKLADELIVTSEEIQEAATQAQSAIESLSSSFKETEQFVSSSAERFAELAQGVDMLTGKNLSLTTDDYEEFLSLSNQLAEVFPTLSRNYDENGNAIVKLSGDANTMVSSLESLLEAQRQLVNQDIAEQLPDLYQGVYDKSKEYTGQIKTSTVQRDEYLKKIEHIDSIMRDGFTDWASNDVFTIEDADIVELYKDAAKLAGYTFWENLGENRYQISDSGLPGSRDSTEEIQANIKSAFKEIAEQYNEELGTLNNTILSNTNKNKANWSSLSSAIASWLSTDSSYKVLGDDLQSFAQTMVNNIDFSTIEGGDTWEGVQTYIRNHILDPIGALGPEAKEKFKELMTVDTGDFSTKEYIDEINNLASELSNMEDVTWSADEILKNTGYDQIIKQIEDIIGKIEALEDVEITKDQLLTLNPNQITKSYDIIKKYGIKTFDDLQEAIDNQTYDVIIDLDAERGGMEALRAAIDESVSATGLSSESISELQSRYQDLEDYDPSRLFEETTNGIHLNTEALRELESEYEKQNMDGLDEQLKDLQEDYNGLTEDIRTCTDASELADLYTQRQNVLNKINDTITLTSQYKGLTSAYNKWQQAQAGGQEKDMYEGVISGIEEVNDAMSRGWFGETEKSFIQMLSDKDLANASDQDYLDEWKRLNKEIEGTKYSVADFFTKDEDDNSTSAGVYNFFDAVKAKQEELGKEWVKIGEDGSYIFDFGKGGDKAVADALNISEELVQIILRAADDAGFTVNMDSAFEQLELLESDARDANEVLKDLGKTEYTFTFNTDSIDELNNEIKEAKKIYDSFEKNEDGTINLDVDGAEEARGILATLMSQKQALESKTILSFDVSGVTEDSEIHEQAVQAAANFKKAFNEYEFDVQFGTDVDKQEAKKKLDEALAELQSDELKDAIIDLGINPASIDEANQSIANLDKNKVIDLLPDDTKLVEYDPDANGAKQGTVEYDVDKETSDANIAAYTVPTKYGKIVYSTEIEDDGDTEGYAPSGGGVADGNFHITGGAFAGGSVGAPRTEAALVGELGPELLVRNGRWTTVGDNGAEFTQVKKGDIIFNHKQTEQLLKNGYVTGRGKLKGGNAAFVSGTAYSDGGGLGRYTISNTIEAIKGASDSISDAADEFREVFDWIEVRLEEINEDISLRGAQLENKVGYKAQNKTVDYMIDLNQKLYDNLIAGANRYYAYAEKLLAKVPEEYRKAAQDGTIAIEEFVGETDEKTLEAIQEYREWVQKGDEVTQQAEETLTEISTLAKQAIDNIAADYDNKTSLRENKIDQYEAYNALLETDQGFESATIYQKMINENNKIIDSLEQQRDKMQEELNKRVESGEIKKYSQDWYDAVNDIAAVDTEIIELTTDTENWQDAINQLHWDKFDSLIGRLESVSNEAENLIDILSNEDMVDESGSWTDEGITALGLHAQRMEAAEVQAKKFADEIAYLDKNWKKLGYTEEEYLEKREELKEGQYDAIKAYHEEKDSIVDLNKERVDAIKEGIEKEVEAYEELIEIKKKELDAEKDLHDFQKNVADQQKNITDIERKLAALSGDNSASARAKRAQLEAELAEARAELEETYYERSISDQQEALDKELENFQAEKDKEMEGWDEYLENTEQVVSDSLSTIQANTDVVYQTLKDMGKEYGLSITESITSPWKKGESAIQSFSEQFGISMSATVDELKELELEFKETMLEIEQAGIDAANTVKENAQGYTEAEYQNPKEQEPKKEKPKKEENPKEEITIGSTVDAGDAPIYSGPDNKNTPHKQYYANDPEYIVVKKGNGYIAVRHHSLNNGITGWFKDDDLKVCKYAKGTTSVPEDQLALIDELGEELRLIPDGNGRLAYMKKGTGVVPADLTSNLMKWGELDPSIMLDQNRPAISAPHITNNETVISIEYGDILHIDNFSGDKPEDLSKMIDKAFDKHMKDLNQQIRRYTRR